MRDDEEAGQGEEEQKGPQIEAHNAPEIFKILYAVGERFPSIWEKIKEILKQSTSTLGVRLIVILLYAYASIIGLIYEWELYKTNDLKLNLFNYLSIGDFLFLALKNGHSFFAFVLGLLFVPLLVCIVFAAAIIGCSLVLDIIHLLVFKTHRYLDRVARMEWHRVQYLNYRDKIPDNAVISSRLKHFIFFAPLIVSTIIKNVYIAIFRIAIPWLLHGVKSHLAGIGASFFGIWGKIIALLKSAFKALLRPVLQPVLKLSLIVLFLVSIVSPVLLVLFPKHADEIVQNLPLIRDFGFKFSPPPALGGQLRTARPSRCIDGAKHISSTEKYAMFSVPRASEFESDELFVVPINALVSFQVSQAWNCEPEKPKVTSEDIKNALEAHSKAASMRDASITAIEKSVAEIKEKIDTSGSFGDEKSVKVLQDTVEATQKAVKKSAEDSLARDGEIKMAVIMTHQDVKKGVDVAGEIKKVVDANAESADKRYGEIHMAVDAAHKTVKESAEAAAERNGEIREAVDATHKAVKESTRVVVGAVNSTHEDVKKGVAIAGDVNTAADEIGTAVKSTHEAVIKSAKVVVAAVNMTHADVKKGVGVAGEIKKEVDATHQTVKKSAEAADERHGEIKKEVDATHADVKKSAEDSLARDGEIKEVVKATHETAKISADTAATRDDEIKTTVEAIHETVKESAEAVVARDGEIKMVVDATLADLKKGAVDAATRDAQIKMALDATHEDVKKGFETAEERHGEIRNMVKETKDDMSGLLTELPRFPVSRFVTVDKIESQIRYLFAGFKPLEYELKGEQFTWLQEFHEVIKLCEPKSGAPIRLRGYASSELYVIQDTFLAPDLCKSDNQNSSATKNCRLAIRRVASVAAYFQYRDNYPQRSHTPNEGADKSLFDNIVRDIIKEMNKHCNEKKAGDLRFVPGYISIKPWCKPKEMQDARLKISDARNQPHFLNRSVHIIFEKLGQCAEAGF